MKMNIYNKLSIEWIIMYMLLIFAIIFGDVNHSNATTEAEEDFKRGELYWLTMNVYHEARGEKPFGMLLVALVTLDRQNDGRWGDTIKSVVTYPHQFSWHSDGKSDIPTDEKSWNMSKRIAIFAQMIYSMFGDQINITHYHNKTVDPYWSGELKRVLIAGNHIFYNEEK